MTEEQIQNLSLFFSDHQTPSEGTSSTEGTTDSNGTRYNLSVLDSVLETISSNLDMYSSYDWKHLYTFILYKIHQIRSNYSDNSEEFQSLIDSIDSHFERFEK